MRLREIHNNSMQEMERLKTRRDERLRPLLRWLDTEVAPVIEGLLRSAVDAVSHLEQKSIEIATSRTQLEGVRRDIRRLALPRLRVDDMLAETQKALNHISRAKMKANERLDD